MSYVKSSDIARQSKSLSEVQTLDAIAEGLDVALMARWRKLLLRMKTPRLLLRILLCASLVLNGLSPATAAMQMQMASMGTDSAAEGTTSMPEMSDAKPPCHGPSNAGGHPAAVEARSQQVSDQSSGMKTEVPLAACCKAGHCDCACPQHSQAMLTLGGWTFPPEAGGALLSTAGAHSAPSFPRLIRPPIS